jgi:hypothetical protein
MSAGAGARTSEGKPTRWPRRGLSAKQAAKRQLCKPNTVQKKHLLPTDWPVLWASYTGC